MVSQSKKYSMLAIRSSINYDAGNFLLQLWLNHLIKSLCIQSAAQKLLIKAREYYGVERNKVLIKILALKRVWL